MIWLKQFKYNPLPALLKSGNSALVYFVQKDLQDHAARPIETLWSLSEAQKIIKKQLKNGAWKYPGGHREIRSQNNYNQIETYRQLGILVEMYGFDRSQPAIKKATEWLFSCQSQEGDFRGIYNNQYSPNYSAGIAEILIKAGYGSDNRIKKFFSWILTLQNDDGGWVIPSRVKTRQNPRGDFTGSLLKLEQPLKSPKSAFSSHLVTDIVLRAFAVHDEYCRSPEAKKAGQFLKSRFSQPDYYCDRGQVEFWFKFQYPFWWNSLLSALSSLYHLGFKRTDPDIKKGLDWFIKNQQPDGLWPTGYDKGQKAKRSVPWIALAICRMFKNFYG